MAIDRHFQAKAPTHFRIVPLGRPGPGSTVPAGGPKGGAHTQRTDRAPGAAGRPSRVGTRTPQ